MNRFETAIKLALALKQVEEWRSTVGFENAESWEVTRQQGDIDFAVCGRFSRQYVADPIFTPLFTALLGSGGFTLFGTTIAYASVASAIATTAIVAGIQYTLTPKPPTPEDGRVPLTQPLPYRFWGVGKCRLAGAFMLWEAKNNHLMSVQAIVGHRINGFSAFYLHDDEVTLQETGEVNPVGERYADNVYIWTRVGVVPETAYEEIVARLGAEDIWTEDHRLDGTASLGMLCAAPGRSNESTCFPNGKPILSAEAELALVWDMRDPDQDPRDASTWVYSENPVLQLCWHECFNEFGNQRDYRKAILPVLDMWQEEADVCDEQIARASGGTENRYTCGGYDTTENGPKSGTNAILASMDGWMCERGDGALLIVAGKFREKYVASITDDDIIGHKLENDVLFDEEVNRLIPKFTYPATLYTSTDTEFFEDTPAQILAGRILPLVANFPWVNQWRQARRLGRREFSRVRERKRGSLDLLFTGINAAYAPWVRLQTPKRLPTLNGKVLSNRNSKFAPMQGGFQMAFIKMPGSGPEIDDWTPAADEGPAPPVPPKPIADGIPDAVIDTAIAVGTGSNVYLRVVLIDPLRPDIWTYIRYRIKDVGGGTPGAWVVHEFDDDPVAGLITCNTPPVPNDELLQIQAAHAVIGATGNWRPTTALELVATVDNVPPLALLTFSASDGTGQFVANFGTQTDAHVHTVAIYKVPGGGVLNRSAHLVAAPAVSPGIAYAIPVTSGSGAFDIYAEGKNISGIPGPLSGPDAATVS